MKTRLRYDYLIVPCAIFWGITTMLQVSSPHPTRGLIGNMVMTMGLLMYHIYAMRHRRRTFLYDPDKNNTTPNWIVFVILVAFLIILIGLLYRNMAGT